VTRGLGLQSVIVSRDSAGKIHVLFNRCTHRGAQVCQGDSGKARTFVCPYHAWSFGLDGTLKAVAAPAGYPRNFDKSALGLKRVPRVSTSGGFIFGSLSETGPSLEEHLGKATALIDQLVGLSPRGRIKLTAGWIKHRIRCNWKMIAENQVDGYHAPSVHGSLLAAVETFATVRDRKDSSPTGVRDFGMGHSDIDHASDYRTAGDRLFRWTGGVPESRFPNYIAAMEEAYGREEGRRRL